VHRVEKAARPKLSLPSVRVGVRMPGGLTGTFWHLRWPAATEEVRKPRQLQSWSWWDGMWDYSSKKKPKPTQSHFLGRHPKKVGAEAHPALSAKSLQTTFHGHSSHPSPHGVCTPQTGRTQHPWVSRALRVPLRSCLTFAGGSEEVAASWRLRAAGTKAAQPGQAGRKEGSYSRLLNSAV